MIAIKQGGTAKAAIGGVIKTINTLLLSGFFREK
jgi:hypothetical protein